MAEHALAAIVEFGPPSTARAARLVHDHHVGRNPRHAYDRILADGDFLILDAAGSGRGSASSTKPMVC